MKLAIILGILVLVLFTACGGATETTKDTLLDLATSSDIDEHYIKFEAEVACSMLEVEEGDDVLAVMANVVNIANKHGLSEEDISNFKLEYEDKEEFTLAVFAEMNSQCPEAMAKAQI